mmetsp:Transcript_27900/g.89969  ORF Transcript_27900/g.89969 Transcript_27900/m.89969 type:complete len:213 (-) Transcript_27900:191-829(-)
MRRWRCQRRWILFEGWWIVQRMVLPSSLAMATNAAQTSRAILLSKPDVGSSQRITSGCVRSSRPMDTRFRWPPLKPRRPVGEPTRVSAHDRSPNLARTTSTRSSPTPRSWALYLNVSLGVSPPRRTSSWGIRQATSLKKAIDPSRRRARTDPSTRPRFQLKPPINSKSDVFPEPDGPMILVAVPAANEQLILSRITFASRRRQGADRGNVTT